MLSLIALLPLVAAYATPQHSSTCFDFEIPLSFKALSLEPSFPPFENHYQSVNFLNIISRRTQGGPSPIKGPNPNAQVDVTIAAKYCRPTVASKNITQILTHGLGFDQSYWSFGGENSQYNYIKAATAAGYATLSYDRIGNGKSTKSDPYTINQLQIEVEVLRLVTEHLRKRDIPALEHIACPEKIVHVGHSYGSQISNGLVAKYPTASDGVILTAFSKNTTLDLLISSNFHLARENIPGWKKLSSSSGYLTWGDELSNQYSFLHYPNFAPEVLAEAEKTKQPFTVGEVLTSATFEAKNFTAPVLIISGKYDVVFCGGDCTGVLEQAAVLFPAAKPFSTYIQRDTGHGLNLHYNATGSYKVIQDFIGQHI